MSLYLENVDEKKFQNNVQQVFHLEYEHEALKPITRHITGL